jgi:hypothetical protein
MSDDQFLISKQALWRGVIAASVLAGTVLVTVILPAEYGIDLTGAGKALGFDKIAATEGAAVVERPETTPEQITAMREDEIAIEVGPFQGLEYKLQMAPGAKLEHSWSVTDGELFFDFHSEPQGDTTGYYESFMISTAKEVNGLFYAPFEGSHGWYWKNKGAETLTVTLKIKGQYNIIGLKQ